MTFLSANGHNKDVKSTKREQSPSEFAHTVKCATECSYQCPLLLTVVRPLPYQRLTVRRLAFIYEGRLRQAPLVHNVIEAAPLRSLSIHTGYSLSKSTSHARAGKGRGALTMTWWRLPSRIRSTQRNTQRPWLTGLAPSKQGEDSPAKHASSLVLSQEGQSVPEQPRSHKT